MRPHEDDDDNGQLPCPAVPSWPEDGDKEGGMHRTGCRWTTRRMRVGSGGDDSNGSGGDGPVSVYCGGIDGGDYSKGIADSGDDEDDGRGRNVGSGDDDDNKDDEEEDDGSDSGASGEGGNNK